MISIKEVRKIAKKNLEKNKLKELKEIDKEIILAAKRGRMYMTMGVRFLKKEEIEMIYGREGYKIEHWSSIPGCHRMIIDWSDKEEKRNV